MVTRTRWRAVNGVRDCEHDAELHSAASSAATNVPVRWPGKVPIFASKAGLPGACSGFSDTLLVGMAAIVFADVATRKTAFNSPVNVQHRTALRQAQGVLSLPKDEGGDAPGVPNAAAAWGPARPARREAVMP
jgi:hypothetical protein